MSHLTDAARAAHRDAQPKIECPNSLEAIIAANPARRTILKNSLFGLSLLPIMGALGACDDDNATPAPSPTPTGTPAPSYAINFTSVTLAAKAPDTSTDLVRVPNNYTVDVLLKAGDSVATGTAYAGTIPTTSAQTETWAGGNHDGMEYYELTGVDANNGGLLVLNHELPDYNILFATGSYNAGTATAEQKKIALSAVGVSVVEIAKGTDGKFAVKAGSRYNKRYTGNTSYRVGGPAAGVITSPIIGTLNNCSSGRTPWGTYLTCEETTDNYIDPTQPEIGYGWVVEIDPYGELAPATKRTAMGRFDHENTAFMTDSANRVAFYMGDDGTPGCIYKFIPDRPFSPTNRAANTDLLDYGTLYVAQFSVNGAGQRVGKWIPLVQGTNGLVVGASDPGNISQFATPPAPTTVDFATQADVLINTKSAARVAGGTVMDRPEWITVAPNKQSIFVTLTNNGSRVVTDAANPRATNPNGHILKFREDGDSPLATTFTWEIFLLAGNPSPTAPANQKGDINGDAFSSPDGIRIDPQGRLWVQTDAGVGASVTNIFGNNSMYYIDQTTKQSKRFLVGPNGCEITGLAYTPDLKTFFINIQHPTGNWPVNGQQPRSSTIVVRQNDNQPIGN